MLTPRQKEILDFVKSYTKEKGYSPSLENIKKKLRLNSVATIHQHIKALETKGEIQKQKNQPRSIEISKSEQLVRIKLLGTISAGQPIEALTQNETIAVPKSKLPASGALYALKVIGDSMIDENIHDGDVILVKEQSTAENGQKVVALLDNQEATLKKFYKERGHIRLQPANKNMEPIIIQNGKEIQIQGIVLDIIKNENQKEINLKTKINKKGIPKKNLEKHLNKVFFGDIMGLLRDMPGESVDMIFGDPDYNVGIKYGGKSYTKNFDEYIDWYIQLTKESMRVLKNDGNLFMLNYPKQNAYLWVKYLDKNFPNVSEYTWTYNTNVGHTPKRFTTAHRTILHIRKSKFSKFYKENVALPYKNPADKRILANLANGSKGRMPYSWFYFDLVKNVSKEKTFHACQIPQKLTEMLIKASTKPQDTVLVLFGGSGAELEICKLLNRKYISAEIDEKYHKLIIERLKNGINSKHKLITSRASRKIREKETTLIIPRLFSTAV